MKRDEQTILADTPGFGRVYDCGDCGCIHLQVGAISITFTPEAYMKLVAMVNTSAASMEPWIQSKSGEPGSGV
jgi:hypothetical protein